MAKSRRSYKGAPISNTIAAGGLAANATSISVSTAFSGWPTGTDPFFVVVDPGTSKEEKICVKYSNTTTLTVVDPAITSGWVASVNGRGADDTTDRNHDAGATIYPVFTAREANDMNELVAAYTANGDLVVHGSSSFKKIAVGTNAHVLQADSSVTDGGVKWGQVTTAGIADSAVTSAKIADGTIVLADLAASLQAFLVPVGTIQAYAGATAPTGWLLCDGTSTTGYTALAALVGATTPDLRGKFLLGKTASGTGSTLLGSGGSTTIAEANLPSHRHTNTATASTSVTVDTGGSHQHTASSGTGGSHDHTWSTSGSGTHTHLIATDLLTSTVAHGHGRNGEIMGGTSVTPESTGSYIVGVDGAHDHSGTTSSHAGHSHSVTVDTAAGHTHTASATTTVTMTNGLTGSGTAYFQPFVAVSYIIKHD